MISSLLTVVIVGGLAAIFGWIAGEKSPANANSKPVSPARTTISALVCGALALASCAAIIFSAKTSMGRIGYGGLLWSFGMLASCYTRLALPSVTDATKTQAFKDAVRVAKVAIPTVLVAATLAYLFGAHVLLTVCGVIAASVWLVGLVLTFTTLGAPGIFLGIASFFVPPLAFLVLVLRFVPGPDPRSA